MFSSKDEDSQTLTTADQEIALELALPLLAVL